MDVNLKTCVFNGLELPVDIVLSTGNNIGLFDIEYHVNCDQSYAQNLINWLAVNCQENFIVTQDRCIIVAGGRYTNKSAFENGRFDIDYAVEQEKEFCSIIYRVRITNSDNTLFKLVWVK